MLRRGAGRLLFCSGAGGRFPGCPVSVLAAGAGRWHAGLLALVCPVSGLGSMRAQRQGHGAVGRGGKQSKRRCARSESPSTGMGGARCQALQSFVMGARCQALQNAAAPGGGWLYSGAVDCGCAAHVRGRRLLPAGELCAGGEGYYCDWAQEGLDAEMRSQGPQESVHARQSCTRQKAKG